MEVVGFTVSRRIERDGKLRGVAVQAGDVRIILNQDDGAKGWDRVKGQGMSFQISTTQNVDAVAKRILERGGALEMEPKDMPWGRGSSGYSIRMAFGGRFHARMRPNMRLKLAAPALRAAVYALLYGGVGIPFVKLPMWRRSLSAIR